VELLRCSCVSRDLDRQEKDATSKLKQAHSKGREAEVRSLAKQIARIRKSREQMQQTNSRLTSIKSQNTQMVSSAIAIETMGVAGQAMGAMNQVTGGPQQMQQTMQSYAREMEKMNVSEEMWGELMDDFDGEEVETEADELVNQVMEEAGLNLTAAMGTAPSSVRPAATGRQEAQQQSVGDKEVDELLASLMQTPA